MSHQCRALRVRTDALSYTHAAVSNVVLPVVQYRLHRHHGVAGARAAHGGLPPHAPGLCAAVPLPRLREQHVRRAAPLHNYLQVSQAALLQE